MNAAFFNDPLLLAALAGAVLGALLGGLAVGLLCARRLGEARTHAAVLETRIDNREDLLDERQAVLDLASQRLTATVDALADRSLQNNSEHFLRLARENLGRHQQQAANALDEREQAVARLIQPVTEALEKTRRQIEQVEKERHSAFGSVAQQLRMVGEQQKNLQTETANLVNALRRPEVRGRWGEITLRRVAELAGMLEHCDFEEQVHRTSDDGPVRPDLLVRLPEKRTVVIDAKTPLDAYLAAIEATDEATRAKQLERHARQVRDRVRELAGKKYWSQFRQSPEFVVLFLAGDQFLSAALTRDPELLDDALRQKVIVATPSSLMALLKTVAHGWRQLELNDNAEVIRELAEVLYHRLATFTTHLAKLGGSLTQSVGAFNSAVGSLERQVLPQARRFTELGVAPKREVASLDSLDATPRSVTLNAETDDVPVE